MRTILALVAVIVTAQLSPAWAQVPVIDNANLQKAQEIATSTQKILTADQQIMQFTQKTLQAVTGDRSSQAQGTLAQMALGGGFSMAQAPSLGSVISGGALSFAGMGSNSQNIVSTLINGLQLVQTITGLTSGQSHPVDTAYKSSVNVAATLSGLINSTQSAVQQRSSAFKQGGQQIGQAQDLKGSIDQNTQVQVQTGLTINELNGVANNAAAAANQANLDRIAAESAAARAMKFTQ
ncbi:MULTISPECIES: type IV secretion system protein [Hyphomicrobiales]|uniref:type IV secretion system protein n=1 Tax=Hyphomicrobiales TaxID=356 RepID=UPI0003DEFAC1|nr:MULTISPECIES: type IV secretion system protein [Hyphomicrobiales]CAH1662863.1 Conjugal transfer protein [Hyphomicrobiales bacterium]ETR79430.1 conjugal transfer protein [Afipia sp. P52-10]MBS7743605.1 conjugal transfer protein [Chelatococcus sp. HY11]MBX3546492.1 conjugal transfer protein [Chelatococcus sp.]MCO5079791.1 conjugal transfer protein [Chelatococcus sp.]